MANYGFIEGSERKNWTGSKTWAQGINEIFYMKYDQFGILEEILLITTAEFRDSFVPSDDALFLNCFALCSLNFSVIIAAIFSFL